MLRVADGRPRTPVTIENCGRTLTAGEYFSAGGWRNAAGVALLARQLHSDAFALTSACA